MVGHVLLSLAELASAIFLNRNVSTDRHSQTIGGPVLHVVQAYLLMGGSFHIDSEAKC